MRLDCWINTWSWKKKSIRLLFQSVCIFRAECDFHLHRFEFYFVVFFIDLPFFRKAKLLCVVEKVWCACSPDFQSIGCAFQFRSNWEKAKSRLCNTRSSSSSSSAAKATTTYYFIDPYNFVHMNHWILNQWILYYCMIGFDDFLCERGESGRISVSGSNDQIAFVLVSKRSEPFLWYRFSLLSMFDFVFFFSPSSFGSFFHWKSNNKYGFLWGRRFQSGILFFFIPAGCLEIYRWHERMWPEWKKKRMKKKGFDFQRNLIKN